MPFWSDEAVAFSSRLFPCQRGLDNVYFFNAASGCAKQQEQHIAGLSFCVMSFPAVQQVPNPEDTPAKYIWSLLPVPVLKHTWCLFVLEINPIILTDPHYSLLKSFAGSSIHWTSGAQWLQLMTLPDFS